MSDWTTIPQMIFSQAKRLGNKPALRAKGPTGYREISWSELAHQVESIALGLTDLGVQPKDRVAILSENRPEWAAVDLGILTCGAVTVPIYTSLTTEEIRYILTNADAHVLFVSTTEMMAKVITLQEELDLKAILFDAPYRISGPRVWWLGELLGLGYTSGPETRESIPEAMRSAGAEEIASIIYTSGTTGPPKGVMLTHRNFLSNCTAIEKHLPIGETDSTLSFLPLSHVFERTTGYYFVLSVGGTITYAQSIEKVGESLPEVRPTILIGVPRFYEKFHEKVQAAIREASPVKQAIFQWAIRVGRAWVQAATEQGSAPPLLSAQYRIAQALVFSKLKNHMGGRLRFCISGGAPLSKELAEFFYAAGILILEGYGLTETSPVISANQPDHFKFGTVGRLLPEIEARIAQDGEILSRGPHIMKGYFNNPKATAEVIDAEGWFHTGDIGELDADGFLKITDRKKDLLKTSGGKMVAPQNLEAAFKSTWLIDDCVVIGDRRKYLTALIVPKMEKLEEFARHKAFSWASAQQLVDLPEVKNLVWETVQRVNQNLASFEQIKKIALLPEPFTLASGELTPTLKVKRRVVAERYAREIEAMYQE